MDGLGLGLDWKSLKALILRAPLCGANNNQKLNWFPANLGFLQGIWCHWCGSRRKPFLHVQVSLSLFFMYRFHFHFSICTGFNLTFTFLYVEVSLSLSSMYRFFFHFSLCRGFTFTFLYVKVSLSLELCFWKYFNHPISVERRLFVFTISSQASWHWFGECWSNSDCDWKDGSEEDRFQVWVAVFLVQLGAVFNLRQFFGGSFFGGSFAGHSK